MVTFTEEILNGKLHFLCSDDIIEANIRKLSTKVERAASGIRRLKTPYWSTMGDKKESDLNLSHIQWVSNIDIQSVA